MEDGALSVTELTRGVKARLEGDYPDVWVEGQLTNYRGVNASGHRYFSLKDEGARLDAVLFKFTAARGLAFELEDGQQVLAHGRVSVYEPRGSYQLVCDRVELKGVGALQAAFEQLKRKLQGEGLFDEDRKRPLPAFPRRVAVITSPSGAVIQDIFQVTSRRCPWLPLVLLPVRVQGEGAKEEIVAAHKAVGEGLAGPVDLVVLARGGGSLEDLWAFNEEIVARAIAACPVPVLSAVGHEVDTTIADFVADRRAPTPSAAAEILCPSSEELRARMESLLSTLRRRLEASLGLAAGRLDGLRHRLQRSSPRFRLEQGAQRFDELRQRLGNAMQRLSRSKGEALRALAAQLQALSPLAILARGYAAVFDGQGALLRTAEAVAPGQRLRVLLGKGELDVVVDKPFKERRDG
jgi:exodeoxyribonuclease VII large subunit